MKSDRNNPYRISDYYKLLELQPDHQKVLLQLAQALVRQEQMEEAIASLLTADWSKYLPARNITTS